MRYFVTLASGRSYTVFVAHEDKDCEADLAKQKALYMNAAQGHRGSWVTTCFAG